MSIIEKLKKESLRLRKERSPVSASIVFALSEIEKIGKNAGNRETTEDEAIRVIQKIVTTINENLKHADSGRAIHLNYEKVILESVLPEMTTEDEIRSKIVFTFDCVQVRNKGEIMKWAKSHWGSRVDMKLVGKIASELYGV